MTFDDLLVVAQTIYGEARNQSRLGKKAVAHVIKNRAAKPGWWGRDVQSVCLKPKQFSCWNSDDPNREKLLAATLEDPAFAACYLAACEVLLGRDPDLTFGSSHYHALSVEPKWAASLEKTVSIGNHVFYR